MIGKTLYPLAAHAIGGAKRSERLPVVPTVAEILGIPSLK